MFEFDDNYVWTKSASESRNRSQKMKSDRRWRLLLWKLEYMWSEDASQMSDEWSTDKGASDVDWRIYEFWPEKKN